MLYSQDEPQAGGPDRSKRLQESDQRALIARREVESILVTRRGLTGGAARQSRGVQPVFQRGTLSTMPEWAAIPDAFQRRDLVVSGATPGEHRKFRVCADAHRHHIGNRSAAAGDVESGRRCQLIVRIERSRMTAATALSFKDPPPGTGLRVHVVWIGRRLERIEVLRERIECLVRVTGDEGRHVRAKTEVSP